ncbi:hypothetical protein SBV1_1560035 [Verrucomicrobia bacterium]|nr:hypothetical protein SBV1_1560035 [Verrucomicrobiota bacterium]
MAVAEIGAGSGAGRFGAGRMGCYFLDSSGLSIFMFKPGLHATGRYLPPVGPLRSEGKRASSWGTKT